jgi:proline iminopeptidase
MILGNVGVLHSQNKDVVFNTSSGKLHYQLYGKGAPILIINGGPGMNSEGFKPLAEELSKSNTVILYDQRGTGLSTLHTLNSETVTMTAMVEDIELLRCHLNFEEWIVLGHSFGGMLAYYYTANYPEHVSSLIQSSSGGLDLAITERLDIRGSLTQTQRDSLDYYSRKISNGDTSYVTAYNRGKFLAPAYVYDSTFIPVVANRLTQGNRTINSLVWQDLRRIEFSTASFFKTFKKPVLIIHGREDVVGLTIPKHAHNILPNSELVILENCKHYGWLDAKTAYFKAINTFIKNL